MGEGFIEQWRRWKDERERTLAAPLGWLALVSLDWLDDRPRGYAGLPGVWWQDEDAAYFDPQGAQASQSGFPVLGQSRFELVDSGAGARIAIGDVEVEVARRGGYLIRVHDPKAAALLEFDGVPSYPPDPDWRIEGVYEPFPEPRPTTVGAVVEGLSHVYTAPGVVRFSFGGQEHALTAFNGKRRGLNVLFTDATSGVTTYAANRSLEIAEPDEAGRVILDFNRATNLPCAFTDYATCPLPPEGNTLPFAVEAGEKTPHGRG
ncbi:DUF1684 domain-containing protein [Actinosynnema mirum]|uniref:DUF1684 domain-containing protein n=1 Tax=Actinosynnema mirum (strain ATCC 29888 / DSM 43827 / JCM 3225 / NBRC 14064 / NCIMB 13271 / NRRL B-12336 / IMRU 3971 / 101) TaxID=446462 RepID=C6WRQ9_ACTMD|nr:DUF1684 domain-containing protein [Actinosynnema mirum]ACU36901.1 protein of unknown function DUF1684 [Actinosynnema mirum DSM 43827]